MSYAGNISSFKNFGAIAFLLFAVIIITPRFVNATNTTIVKEEVEYAATTTASIPINTTVNLFQPKRNISSLQPVAGTKNVSNTQYTTSPPITKAIGCKWLMPEERDLVTKLEFSGANTTKWFTKYGGPFLDGIAHAFTSIFNDSELIYKRSHVDYVEPIKRLLPLTTNTDEASIIYVTLRITNIKKSKFLSDYQDATKQFKQAVKQAAEIFSNENIVNISMSEDAPPICSLFFANLPLWIGILVFAFLLIVLSVTVTCCCWKRGKSVQLKHKKSLTLPSTDELASIEYSGIDNPAMTITVDAETPFKKKAPTPPTSTPDMTTFGMEHKKSYGISYETGIVPFKDSPIATKSNNGDMTGSVEEEVLDTKL